MFFDASEAAELQTELGTLFQNGMELLQFAEQTMSQLTFREDAMIMLIPIEVYLSFNNSNSPPKFLTQNFSNFKLSSHLPS